MAQWERCWMKISCWLIGLMIPKLFPMPMMVATFRLSVTKSLTPLLDDHHNRDYN